MQDYILTLGTIVVTLNSEFTLLQKKSIKVPQNITNDYKLIKNVLHYHFSTPLNISAG